MLTGGTFRACFCSDGFRDGPLGLVDFVALFVEGVEGTTGEGGTFSLGVASTGVFADLSLVASVLVFAELSSVRVGAPPLPLAALPPPRPPRPLPGRPFVRPRKAEPGSPLFPHPVRGVDGWFAHIEELVPPDEDGGAVEEDIVGRC